MLFQADRDFTAAQDVEPPTESAPVGAAFPASDEALMQRVGAGDVAAFRTIVERHSRALYRVASRMLADGAEAEEVVQEAFARLWQGAPRWQASGAGLVAWLHRVAVNACLDRLRRFRVVTVDTVPDIADETPGPDRMVARSQLDAALQRALAQMQHRHRAVLVLCYLEGFTNALAAEILGLTLKATESLLVRARKSLRAILEDSGILGEELEVLA